MFPSGQNTTVAVMMMQYFPGWVHCGFEQVAFVCGAWQLLTCYQPVGLDMHVLVFVRETH